MDNYLEDGFLPTAQSETGCTWLPKGSHFGRTDGNHGPRGGPSVSPEGAHVAHEEECDMSDTQVLDLKSSPN